MAALQVRRAAVGDARAIAEVNVASWQAAYRHAMPADVLASLSVEQREAQWRRVLTGGSTTVIVAEVDAAVAGYAAVSPTRDADADSRSVGELQAIYAAPQHWDRGVGHALHDAALAALAGDGFGEATLWVLDDNPRARRFYEHHGWTVDGASRDEQRGELTLREVRYRRPLP